MARRKLPEIPSLTGLPRAEVGTRLEQAARELAEFFGRARTSVSIWIADEPGRLALQATTSSILAHFVKNAYYRPGEGLTGWVLKQGKPLHISNLQNASEVQSPKPAPQWRGKYSDMLPQPPRSFLAAPILAGSKVFGVLRVEGIDFTAEQLAVVNVFASELGRALVEAMPELLTQLGAEEIFRVDETAVTTIKAFSADALKRLAANPADMERLTARMFEELIAELLERDGWSVDLTLQTHDGGYDNMALSTLHGVRVQLIVEAKKNRRDRPVGVDIVRALYTVKQRTHSTKAMLATSSHVSPDAKREFVDVIPWEMEMREYDDLVKWINRHT